MAPPDQRGGEPRVPTVHVVAELQRPRAVHPGGAVHEVHGNGRVEADPAFADVGVAHHLPDRIHRPARQQVGGELGRALDPHAAVTEGAPGLAEARPRRRVVNEDAERRREHELDPAERQPCEIWTRVMGYHRPVASFNTGKKGEFHERRHFDEQRAG